MRSLSWPSTPGFGPRALTTFRHRQPFGAFVLAGLLAAVFVLPAGAATLDQAAADSTKASSRVVGIGPDHRVIERQVDDGRGGTRVSRYTELATGLHRPVDDGQGGVQWVETEEKFELVEGGAIARGQHTVRINGDFTAAEVVDLELGGQRFRSRLLGLAMTDMSTGQSVLIAEPQACVGELIAPNVILFRGALAGPGDFDVRYMFTRAGFSQDVICRSRLPEPREYGLDNCWTRLEVWSVVAAPEPTSREPRLAKPEEALLPMLDAGLSDETVRWGALRLGPGRAFTLGREERTDLDGEFVVAKDLVDVEQTRFLVEKVDYVDVEEELQKLPVAAAKAGAANQGQAGVGHASRREALVAALRQDRDRRAQQRAQALPAGPQKPAFQIAALRSNGASPGSGVDPGREPGFVFDYQLVNANTNGTIFKKDTTYFVTGSYSCSGVTTIEGSCVIKMTNGATTTSGRLAILGPLKCETGRYTPANFTSWNDNTAGETIAGSGGSPTNWYGIYLDFSGNTNVVDLHDVRFRHAYYGLKTDSSSQLTVRHSQFSTNYTAIAFGNSRFRNVLIHDGTYVVGSSGSHTFEHVTIHRVSSLRSASYTTAMTNCLLIEVTNNISISGLNNVTNFVGTGYFQSAGSGAHYLIAGSTNHGAAITNINPTLLADLAKLTTDPPLVLTNHFTNDTVLAPRASRGPAHVSIGYMYPPVDYAWTALKVQNARLTLTNDVAIALYGNGTSYGIGLDSGGQLVAQGQPDRPVRLFRHNLAQENASGAWSSTSGAATLVAVLTNGPVAPKLQYRFVESLMPGRDGHHLYGWHTIEAWVFGLRDSYFAGGSAMFGAVGVGLTNCVLDRVFWEMEADCPEMPLEFHHNLFRGGTLWISLPSGCPVTAKNNLFDRTAITQSGAWTHGWNGYFTNLATGQNLTPAAGTDKFLTSAGYEAGPLGIFYYPTNGGAGTLTDLVNAGSATASSMGFYHYCTATNGTKEASSTVDVGFRYIAVNASGTPVDTDGDEFADWLEDANGNGTADSGEIDWQAVADQGFRVWITRPRQGGNLP